MDIQPPINLDDHRRDGHYWADSEIETLCRILFTFARARGRRLVLLGGESGWSSGGCEPVHFRGPSRPAGGNLDHPSGPPEPRCGTCGAAVGIFQGHGSEWYHFRGDGSADSPVELYDAGHAPAVYGGTP